MSQIYAAFSRTRTDQVCEVLPKSVTNSRIEGSFGLYFSMGRIEILFTANFKVVELQASEIEELQAIDKTHHFRACHPDWTGWGSLGFPDCK